MTFFNESNRDATSVGIDAAATGPLVGFLESFNVAYEAQQRTASQFGIEFFMQEQDWKQTQALIEAGVADPPQLMLSLEGTERGQSSVFDLSAGQLLRDDSGYYEDFVHNRSGEYLDVARSVTGSGDVSPEFSARLQAYDARIEALRKERPDLQLQTSSEMFGTVREAAREAERREASNRRTLGGSIGGFLGGTIASMDPRTDPLNFLTLGVGGAGKTVAMRIAAQAGAQGVVEGLNQVTGVQEQRQLMGLSSGFQDAATRVLTTAAGGAILQGAGEAVVAGARRWFRNTAVDPAPEPGAVLPSREAETPPDAAQLTPEQMRLEVETARLQAEGRAHFEQVANTSPLSGFRAATQRNVSDLTDMTARLEDWGGGSPAAALPRTDAAVYAAPTARAAPDVSPALDNNLRYQAAKAADPVAFQRYERLKERRDTYRRWLGQLQEGRTSDVAETLDRIDQRIAQLEARRSTITGKKAKADLRAELREAKADRDALLAAAELRESPDTVAVRREIQKVDEKMRDVAPLIGRAYARSEGRWPQSDGELDAVWDAYLEGRETPDVANAEGTGVPDVNTLMSLQDRAPILRRAYSVEEGATPADTAMRIAEQDAKTINEAAELYATQAKALVSATDDGKLIVQGRETELDLDSDTIIVVGEDGVSSKEITLREYLSDVQKFDDEVEAVSTCSIR